jgi:hypothetical protein
MKSQELRIGNLVLDEYFDERYVICITPYRVHLSSSGDDDESVKPNKVNEIEPILLTEEWLLKFGFKKDKLVFYKDFLLYNFNDGFYFFEMKINHVHQMQNLYFALTGKELTI